MVIAFLLWISLPLLVYSRRLNLGHVGPAPVPELPVPTLYPDSFEDPRSRRLSLGHVGLAPVPELPVPKLYPYSFEDPRSPDKRLGIVAFYFPDKEEPWDTMCSAGFLGNFFPQPPGEFIVLTAPSFPGEPHTFSNAEAAFQALKFWTHAKDFESLSGSQAFELKKRLRGSEDFTYGGFGSNWAGMLGVLRSKYRPGSECAKSLLATGETFLLEHNSVSGRDKVWSDNFDGNGTNWLGLQLMLIRDDLNQLNGNLKAEEWSATMTQFAQNSVELSTGALLGDRTSNAWQQAVLEAAEAVGQG